MRFILITLFVGCAPIERIDLDENADWVAAVGVSGSKVVDSTGLFPSRAQLRIRGGQQWVLGWSAEDLFSLQPPKEAGDQPLRVARDCEPALPPPRFAYRLDGDVGTVDSGAFSLRLTAHWLARRCPCQDEIRPEDFTVYSVELDGTDRTRLRNAALVADDTLLVHLEDGTIHQVDRDSGSTVPDDLGATDLYVAPSGARWRIGPLGSVEREGRLVDSVPDGALLGPPPWASADATLVADAEGRIRDPGGPPRFVCPAVGAPTAIGWESPTDLTVLFGHRLCRVSDSKVANLSIRDFIDPWERPVVTTHPDLGTLFADRDGHLRRADFEQGRTTVVHERYHAQTYEARPITGLASWAGGVILADVFGEVAFFSPETGEIPLQLILTIPRTLIAAKHGFFVVAQHVDSEFYWEENETNVVVWYFERNDCSL